MDPGTHQVADYVGAAVLIASILANFIPPNTVVGKILHFIALNFRKQGGL